MARPANSVGAALSLAKYWGLLSIALVLGFLGSLTPLADQTNKNVYDYFFRTYQPPPWTLSSVILAIDEKTLREFNGMRGVRGALAKGLQLIREAHPKAVAVDVILADTNGGDQAEDDALEAAFAATPRLVLPCDLAGPYLSAQWEDPIPRFKRHAAAVGEVHAGLADDAVSRWIQLEKHDGAERERRWALALEAFRVSRNADIITSPDDLQVGDVVIPVPARYNYNLRIRYVPPSMGAIPRISIADLAHDPTLARQMTGKVVFAGVTAQTAERDRWITPYSDSQQMSGAEMHANIYETIANRRFLVDAPWWLFVVMLVATVGAAGAIWQFTSGVPATLLSGLLLGIAHVFPYWLFTRGMVFHYTPAVLPAWLAILAAAGWQYFYVRRRLGRSEAEKTRYVQAMHFVTHEMRTPLTAIQGSSELINRYPAMPEEKRKQINELIVSESKRLGRMIEVFLNVERLSAGEMELKHDAVPITELVERCVQRATPVANRKQIAVEVEPLPEEEIRGDQELMEYAFYNLLTNAIKYSPAGTRVRVFGSGEKGQIRLSVEDQGIGMDQKEVRRIFEKFYRTRRAEQSGEAGTGIGLSIVEQIVTQHGGSIDVVSSPGQGSCFTLVLPAGSVRA